MTGSDFNCLPPPWLLIILVSIGMVGGLWKVIDIIIWLCHHHIHISFS
jgi:hypothetical protein